MPGAGKRSTRGGARPNSGPTQDPLVKKFKELCREAAIENFPELKEAAKKGNVKAQIFISEQAAGKATQRHEIDVSDIYFVRDQDEIPFDDDEQNSDPGVGHLPTDSEGEES